MKEILQFGNDGFLVVAKPVFYDTRGEVLDGHFGEELLKPSSIYFSKVKRIYFLGEVISNNPSCIFNEILVHREISDTIEEFSIFLNQEQLEELKTHQNVIENRETNTAYISKSLSEQESRDIKSIFHFKQSHLPGLFHCNAV